MEVLKKNRVLMIILGFIFLFYLFITYNVPLSGDDWTWSSKIGIDRLKSFYADYNGRYLSNTLEILLTRSQLLRVLFMALINTLLIYLSAKLISTKKRTSIFALTAIFFIFMLIPTEIFKQTFGWTAGFINYNFSLVLLLAYLVLCKNVFGEEQPHYHKAWIIPVFLLGFFTQLNVEHVSFFANFTSVFVIIMAFVRFKKIYKVHVSYFIGTLFGSILMFTNGAYLNVLFHKDNYRAIDQDVSFVQKAVNVYSKQMHYFLFEKNEWLVLLLAVALIVFLFRSTANRLISYMISVVLLAYSMVIIFFKPEFTGNLGASLFALLSLIYFIAIIAAVIMAFTGIFKWKMIYYLTGIILMSVPFIVITPYGGRCALAPFLCMALIAVEAFNKLKESGEYNFANITKWLMIVSMILAAGYALIMFANGHVDRARLNHLHEQINKGNKTIYYSKLPFSNYGHMLDPEPNAFQTTIFRQQNHVPKDVNIKLIPYERKNERAE